MQVNLCVPLTDLDGNVVKVEGHPGDYLYLDSVCVNALLQYAEPDEKYKCFALANKIHAGKDKLVLTVEEAAFVKSVLAKSQYTPLVIGRIFEILEG